MKQIIALSGLKQSGKVKLCELWDQNANVSYIKPFTDNPKRRFDGYSFLPTKDLHKKMDEESILCSSMVKDFDYIYFQSQLINDYNLLIVDDYALKELKEIYPKIITVWVENPKAEDSGRVGVIYRKSDYDYIYNYGLDEPEEFLEQIAFDREILG